MRSQVKERFKKACVGLKRFALRMEMSVDLKTARDFSEFTLWAGGMRIVYICHLRQTDFKSFANLIET